MSAINLPSHELTFVHIPKNGGSSVVSWLRDNIHPSDMIRGHLSLPMLKQYWTIRRTFAIVRNPWARVVSSYFYLKQYKFYWEYNNITDDSEFPTWDDYVSNLDFKLTDWNTLKTNQYEWMGDGVDYILKCESLTDDFKVIQDILNCHAPLPYINTSEHDDYRTYFNSTQKEIIRKTFEKDIDLFKYSF